MAEPIDMQFWMKTWVGPRNHVLDGGADAPRGRGNFRGLCGPFKTICNLCCSGRCSRSVAAKGISQSPMTLCSRRDHSVCQANANSILKISGRKRCGLLAAKRFVGLHSAGEVWYLRLPCSCCCWLAAPSMTRWWRLWLQRRATHRPDGDRHWYGRHQAVCQCVRWRPVRRRTGTAHCSRLHLLNHWSHS